MIDFFLIFLCTTVIRSGDNTGHNDDDDNDNNKTNSTNNLKCLVIMFAILNLQYLIYGAYSQNMYAVCHKAIQN